MTTPLVSMNNISKQFPGSVSPALHEVSLEIYPGEIHCLAGENGSGKSTLMHILSGYMPADSGTIETSDNISIKMVHQAPLIAGDLRVWEHLSIGSPDEKAGYFSTKKLKERLAGKLKEFRLFAELIDSFDMPAGELKAQEKHRLSIASAVISNPDILILDEPSTHLTAGEKEILFDLMRDLKEKEKSVILITHKLKELKALGDRVTALRRGNPGGTFYKDTFLESDLVSILIEFNKKEFPLAPPPPGGDVMISLSGVCAVSGRERITNIGFEVHKGEVLGILGLKGEGLGLLEQVLAGVTPFTAGEIHIKGTPVDRITPRILRKRNIGYIPTDRLLLASTPDASIEDNLILRAYKKMHNRGVFKKEEITALTSYLYDSYNISGNQPGARLGSLSGGNIQRVIVSREISQTPDIIIFAEPYWGLDAEGKALVTSEIQRLQKEGSAVILLSPESEELFGLAHSYIVLYEGTPVLQAAHENTNFTEISEALLGASGRAE